ncbi:unnamed protein product, partial [marine sediment metagenome]
MKPDNTHCQLAIFEYEDEDEHEDKYDALRLMPDASHLKPLI